MGAIIANTLLVVLAIGILTVTPPVVKVAPTLPAAAPVSPTILRIPARHIPGEPISIATSRSVEVVEINVTPGDAVKAGAALLSLRDLAVVEKRTQLREEVRRLETDITAADTQSAAIEQRESIARIAALAQLQAEYEAAEREFARIQQLFDEGLLARVEFEKHRDGLEFKRLEVELARSAIDRPTAVAGEQPIVGLEPAKRMLERLEQLPDTFELKSPADAIVKQVNAVAGDTPERAATLITLTEDRPTRLVADLPEGSTPLKVVELCGHPGSWEFDLRGREVTVAMPSEREKEGTCEMLIEVSP